MFAVDDNAHRVPRAELGIATPTDPEHITIYVKGGHLATSGASLSATHRPDRRWAIDAVEKTKIRVDGAAPSDTPQVTRVLSVADGEQILHYGTAEWPGAASVRYRVEIPRRIDALTPDRAQQRVTAGNAPPRVPLLDRLITPDHVERHRDADDQSAAVDWSGSPSPSSALPPSWNHASTEPISLIVSGRP